jgi:hypothetical protein
VDGNERVLMDGGCQRPCVYIFTAGSVWRRRDKRPGSGGGLKTGRSGGGSCWGFSWAGGALRGDHGHQAVYTESGGPGESGLAPIQKDRQGGKPGSRSTAEIGLKPRRCSAHGQRRFSIAVSGYGAPGVGGGALCGCSKRGFGVRSLARGILAGCKRSLQLFKRSPSGLVF